MKQLPTLLALALGLVSHVNSHAQLSLSAQSTTICSGDFITITASDTGDAYFWSPSNTLTSDSGSLVLAFPPDTTTYTVISFNNGVPLDTQSITIHVVPPPQISASVADTAVCEGQNFSITVSGSYNYLWTGPTGQLTGTSGSTNTYIADSLGTFEFEIIGSIGTCADTFSIRVRTDTLQPVPSVSIEDTVNCEGLSTEIVVSGGTRYVWYGDTAELDTTVGSTVIATPSVPGTSSTYSFGVYRGACRQDTSISIYNAPKAQVAITRTSNGLPVCRLGRDTLSITGNASDYEIRLPEGVKATSNPEIILLANASKEVWIKSTTSYGCFTRDTIQLVVDSSCVDSAYYINSVQDIKNRMEKVEVNLTRNNLIISSPKQFHNLDVHLFDLAGNNVFQEHLDDLHGTKTIITSLKQGVYIVRLTYENQRSVRKILVWSN